MFILEQSKGGNGLSVGIIVGISLVIYAFVRKIEKPISEFGKKDKNSRFEINTQCKGCKKHKRDAISELNKILIPMGGVTDIPSYRLANPKIPSVRKKKIPFVRKGGCRIEGCQNIPRPSQSVCSFHQYLIGLFGAPAYPLTIKCTDCSKDQPVNEFMVPGSHKIHPSRKCSSCREERRLKANRNRRKNRRARLKLNPQKYAEYKRKQNIRKQNRIKNDPVALAKKRVSHRTTCVNRRARKKGNGGVHTPMDIKFLFDTQKGKCVCCRKSIKNRYHIDHVIPIALGGGSEKENLQLLCQTCNTRKCAKHPIDFMQEQGYLL